MSALAFRRYLYVFLSSVLAGCAHAPSSTDVQVTDGRVPIHDINTFRVNALFDSYNSIDEVTLIQMGAILGVALGNNNLINDSRDRAKSSSDNELARDFIASFDGSTSSLITLAVFRKILRPKSEEDFLRKTSRIFNVVHSSDGREARLPIAYAPILHSYYMKVIGAEMGARRRWADVQGQYHAITRGDCPFSDGPIELTQRQFMVEGVRNGQLLLAGAVGTSEQYFIANEQRYMSARRDASGNVALEAPDRPSELYLAIVDDNEIQLSGQVYRTCTITLSRTS